MLSIDKNKRARVPKYFRVPAKIKKQIWSSEKGTLYRKTHTMISKFLVGLESSS